MATYSMYCSLAHRICGGFLKQEKLLKCNLEDDAGDTRALSMYFVHTVHAVKFREGNKAAVGWRKGHGSVNRLNGTLYQTTYNCMSILFRYMCYLSWVEILHSRIINPLKNQLP